MRNEYAHDEHYQWIERNTKTACSPLGRTVANIIGFVGCGIYNAPINYRNVDWTDPRFIEVAWRGGMANWDFPRLSCLWVECHRRMVWVELCPHTFKHIKLCFCQRATRVGSTSARIPDVEEMVSMIDGLYGRQK